MFVSVREPEHSGAVLKWFEKKHSMSSEDFYRMYINKEPVPMNRHEAEIWAFNYEVNLRALAMTKP